MAVDFEITTVTPDTDLSAYRPGQTLTYEYCRFLMDGDPYGSLFAEELPMAALAEWDLVDDNDEPLENNDFIKQIMKKPWTEIVTVGAPYERAFGQSFFLIMVSDNPKTKGKPWLNVYEPARVDKQGYYNDHTLKKVQVWETDPVSGEDITITIGAEEKDVNPEKGLYGVEKLDDVFWNIIRRKKDWWKGESYFEPIRDELKALRYIRTGATLFAIRVGAGLKIIKIPENTDPAVIADMKDAAQKLESFNGWFLVPTGEAEISIESANMIDYEKLKAVIIESLCAKTGLPRAAFEGVEMERQGGVFNEQRIFDYWRQLQREYEDRLKWVILRFNDYYNFGLSEENFPQILWSNRQTLTEMEQAELDEKVAITETALVNASIKRVDESRDTLSLEGEAPEPRDMFGVKVEGLEDRRDEPNDD